MDKALSIIGAFANIGTFVLTAMMFIAQFL